MTEDDFRDESHLTSLTYSIERLLSVGIVPIINENDAISATRETTKDDMFSDNDSLVALCARNFGCDLRLLLTDVDGVFGRPPNQKGAKLLPFLRREENVGIGEKSRHGRGGMDSKINVARLAVSVGSRCRACVVLSGADLESIQSMVRKEYDGPPPKGTLFATPGSGLEKQALMDVQDDEVGQAFSFAVFFFSGLEECSEKHQYSWGRSR